MGEVFSETPIACVGGDTGASYRRTRCGLMGEPIPIGAGCGMRPIEGNHEAGSWEQPTIVRRSVSLDAAPAGEFSARPAPAWLEPTRFETNSSPEIVARRVLAAVQDAGGEIEQIKPHKSKIKCRIFHELNLVNFHINVYRTNPLSAGYTVEFQKRHGDSFAWNLVFSELRATLADLAVAAQAPARGELAPLENLSDARLHGDAPAGLATMALNVCQTGRLGAQAVAARAFAASVTAHRNGSGEESGAWAELPPAKKLKVMESLSALRSLAGSPEDGTKHDPALREISRCVATTMASLDGPPPVALQMRNSPPPRPYCISDFSLKASGTHGMGMGVMLSSSA